MAKDKRPTVQEEVNLIRILGKDIRGNKKVIAGLTNIKGVSWGFASAVCHSLKLDRFKKIQDLTEKEIEDLEEFIRNPKLPSFMLNRQRDFEDGEDKHSSGEDIKLRREFDIKRLKKIKSYKGIRHGANLPVRGQRTRSHFRINRKKKGAAGIKKA